MEGALVLLSHLASTAIGSKTRSFQRQSAMLRAHHADEIRIIVGLQSPIWRKDELTA